MSKASFVKYQRPRGTRDILPEQAPYWHWIQDTTRKVAEAYNFGWIETPKIEKTQLFVRGIGHGTDIVDKEMYNLTTRGGDVLTLRPEATASIARAYIENGMKNFIHPLKLYTIGSFFRHDRPQAGRLREFHQLDFEIIGSNSPTIDALLIHIFYIIAKELKIEKIVTQINSIGCKECRPEYISNLREYLRSIMRKLPKECRDKAAKNPLRIFDIKEEKCQRLARQGPQIIDHLCEGCKQHFQRVLEFLDHLDIFYELNPYLVRGIDYYTRTVFELWPEGEDSVSVNALCAGGRYDNLIELIGGPKERPAVGFAAGIERLIEYIKAQGIMPKSRTTPRVFIAHLGEFGTKRAIELMENFRKARIPFLDAMGRESLNSQLKTAKRFNCDIIVLFAQKEALENSVIVKDISAGSQETVPIEKLFAYLKKRLAKK